MSIIEPEIVTDALGLSSKVIFAPLPFSKTVSIGLLIGAGSLTEEPSYVGYSHFLEHMLFKGTKRLDFEALNREFEKLGAYVNAFTGKYYTLFYVHALEEFGQQCLSLLLEMVFESILPTEEMEKEKNVILEEIASYKDNPEDYLIEEFYTHTFRDSFFGNPILGAPETIQAITREKLLNYYRKYYSPSNTIVSIAGKFDKNSLLAQLQKYFSNFEPSSEHIMLTSPRVSIPFHKQTQVHYRSNLEQAYVYLGFPVSGENKPRQVLKIFNAILGGMASSRLHIGIREKRALCYAIDSSLYMDPNISFFSIFASTQTKKLQKLLDAIWEEIDSLKSKNISEEEILIAKNQMKSRMIFRQENVSQTMLRLAAQVFFLGKNLSDKKIIEKMEQVSMENFDSLYENFTKNNMSTHTLLSKKHSS